MNFLFHNNKETIKDEIGLLVFILVCIVVGAVLFAYAPAFWIISSSVIKTFGLAWILVGVMFLPGFFYRLTTNESHKKSDRK